MAATAGDLAQLATGALVTLLRSGASAVDASASTRPAIDALDGAHNRGTKLVYCARTRLRDLPLAVLSSLIRGNDLSLLQNAASVVTIDASAPPASKFALSACGQFFGAIRARTRVMGS